MGRKPIGKQPMTKAQYQARWRAKVKRRQPNARGDEWGTPPDYIAAAREVMGAIDLDPATHAEAQERVQATRYFTQADDGLNRQWHGRVFLNPPYARGVVDRFAVKLLVEIVAGRVREAVVLVNNQGGVRWFHNLQDAAAAYCLVGRRIRFLNSDGRPGSSTVGQCFFYFGSTPERFATVFAPVGHVTVISAGPVRDAA